MGAAVQAQELPGDPEEHQRSHPRPQSTPGGMSSAETTVVLVIGELGGQFAILTLLAFAVGFTVRQYTSSRHNETVNLHRWNALGTFETFVSAANDQETKDGSGSL